MRSAIVLFGVLLVPAAAYIVGQRSSPASGAETPTTPSAVAALAPMPEPSPSPPSPVHGTAAPVTGIVAETMEASSYTYVRLTTPQGDQWAAIPQAKLTVGDTVTVANPMVIDGFKSPTLKRAFDHILFGTLAGRPPAASSTGNPHAGFSGAPGPHPGLPGTATAHAVAAGGPPVPKATGANAHTVAEVLAGAATLKDKSVSVRGRVTKFNASILGKNWLHVEDGSVKADPDGTVVVTTSDTAAVGDIVTVVGVVHTGKDFGAGYSYPVLIEEATLAK
jgi:hypothetical protein